MRKIKTINRIGGGHTELGPPFKASSKRPENREIDPAIGRKNPHPELKVDCIIEMHSVTYRVRKLVLPYTVTN